MRHLRGELFILNMSVIQSYLNCVGINMPLILKILIAIPALLFGGIFIGFIIAAIMDLINHYKRKKDLFYQLSRDHNRVRRPAAK